MENIEHITREEIENLLGFRIRNIELYKECFMHKSATKIYKTNSSNERLEFIGDSVLNMIVALYLYEKYPNENEGFLTKTRTKIVNGQVLSKISKELNLQKHVRMNQKALKNGWNNNARILEDVLEALIGSIFLDLGYSITKKFVEDLIELHINPELMFTDNNFKDQLMRFCQTEQLSLPVYNLIDSVSTNNNNRKFHIQVYINDKLFSEGISNTKKNAEQCAAQKALECLKTI